MSRDPHVVVIRQTQPSDHEKTETATFSVLLGVLRRQRLSASSAPQYASILPQGFARFPVAAAIEASVVCSSHGTTEPVEEAEGDADVKADRGQRRKHKTVRSSWTVVDAAADGLARATMGACGSVCALRAMLVDASQTSRVFDTHDTLLYIVRDSSGTWDAFVTTYNAMAQSLRESLFRHNPLVDLWAMLPPDTFVFERLFWYSGADAHAAWQEGAARSALWRHLTPALREDVRVALLTAAAATARAIPEHSAVSKVDAQVNNESDRRQHKRRRQHS